MAIIQRDDELSRLPQTLLQMMVTKEQMSQAKEEMKLRQQDFKLRQDSFKLEQDEAQRQRALQEAAVQGATAAAGLIASRIPGMGGTVQGLAPSALPSFLQNLQGFQQGQLTTEGMGLENVGRGIANAAGAEDLSFAQETRPLRLQAMSLGLAQTQAQTRGINLQNALTQAAVNNDPVRVQQAFDMVRSGQVTWGQAAAAFGINPTGLPEDFRLELPAGAMGGEAGQRQQQAAALFQTMRASDTTMNTLNDAGVRMGLLSSMNRSAKRPLSEWATGLTLDDDERRLVNAHKTFSDAYRYFISGQQSSDAEASRLLFTMVENPNDGEEVLRQKRFMRAMTINMAEQVAQGAMNPEQAAQQILNTATNQGMPEDLLNVFREQLNDAREYTSRGGPLMGGAPQISAAPVTMETLPGAIGNIDNLIDLTLGARSPTEPPRPGGRR